MNGLKLTITVSLIILLTFNSTSAMTPVDHTVIWSEHEVDTSPTGRTYTDLAYDNINEKAMLFGGHGKEISDLTWIFHPENGSWSSIKVDNAPSIRYGHSMVFVQSIEKFVLFGGTSYDGKVINDTWTFDIKTLKWQQVVTNNAPSTPVFGEMTYVPDGNSLLYFGGMSITTEKTPNNRYYDNTLWRFNLEKMEWSQVATSENPSSRINHILRYDPASAKIILYGGLNSSSRSLTDTWIFNIQEEMWIELDIIQRPTSGDYYTWSEGVGADYDPETNRTYFTKDFAVWYLDVQENRWVEMSRPSDALTSMRNVGGQFTYVNQLGGFIQFGGYEDYTSKHLNDTFSMRVTQNIEDQVSIPENEINASEAPTSDTSESGLTSFSLIFSSLFLILQLKRENRLSK